ncbi:MAG: hypothetical protein ACJ74F_11635 [Mycobacterium sp.]|uniref:hypothetical protein n=1 Tax=Mycobacterium sp. TaxID=1785 RepID=UPI00389B35B6
MADQTRGTNQDGEPDTRTTPGRTGLPPRNPRFRPSDTGAKATRILGKLAPKSRIDTFFPYLILRTTQGDTGARPLSSATPAWESCDVHLMPQGGAPFDFAKTVLKPVPGQTYRVFVHAWNLGKFAAYGARVRAWSVELGFFPGVASSRYQPRYIGGAYFELGDRDSGDAHRLVEVSPGWTVSQTAGGHETLVAAVEAATDPWDGVMQSSTHRHVAQRSLALASAGDDIWSLVSLLGSKMTSADQTMIIGHGGVSRASLAGAQSRGLSSSANPTGWNHSGVFGFSDDRRPLAGVRRVANKLRFFDRSHPGTIPLPGSSLAQGIEIPDIAKYLPVYLRDVLHAPDLKASSIVHALGLPAGSARVLRFQTSEQSNSFPPGRSGGFSILLTP